jgi:hypothetical protein
MVLVGGSGGNYKKRGTGKERGKGRGEGRKRKEKKRREIPHSLPYEIRCGLWEKVQYQVLVPWY